MPAILAEPEGPVISTAHLASLNAARLDGQALLLAGSDFPERVEVFLQESLRALIGPIQADA